ncbi:MAG: GNAT family N-acetyltransferase [Chloroflexota bacterium]
MDYDLIAAWFNAARKEATGKGDLPWACRTARIYLVEHANALYIWHNGEPSSIAGIRGITAHSAYIDAVYTPPVLRRRGYATACIAALSQVMHSHGYWNCSLVAALTDLTANHIYQTVGYRVTCEIRQYSFL